MLAANLASTRIVREVPNSNDGIISSIGSLVNLVEQRLLAVLQVSAECIGAQIRNLDHFSKLAIHEQGRFNDIVDLRP